MRSNNADNAALHLDALHEDSRKLGEGMQYIAECLQEIRAFASALSRGNLNAPLPSRQNEFAAPLKSLHASLRHMTWQTQQVAKGDYQQRINFMGEFSEAFNTMIAQLEQRQSALEAEIEKSHQKTRELEQNNDLLEAITVETSLLIFVLAKENRKLLFVNNAAAAVLEPAHKMAQPLNTWLNKLQDGDVTQQAEVKLESGTVTWYHSLRIYPIRFRQDEATAYVLQDITQERRQAHELENAAYRDSLTQLYSRYYGMEILRQWLAKKCVFCLCFADIDCLKYVNDRFGHNEGDRYIINVATHICRFFPNAVISRLGGDEFMILAADKSPKDAESCFQALRDELQKSGKTDTTTAYLQSISFGVVEVGPNNSLEASELLSIADERMYHFKRAHKARCADAGS